ncbi:MAG: hypothetical protein Q9166_004116 [cf. Caloplaca sp. 2 TL-2023]
MLEEGEQDDRDKDATWLDDLCVRFIINLPQEELESVERICFQVEEAQWYYEDFIRPLDPDLPSLNLRNFCLRIFQHCPLLSEFSPYHHATAFEEFLAYKTRVPVRGAIMLNEDMDQVILVKGWKKGANWSFPRGKINKDESDLDCAVREVYEETGYDVKAAGLVGPPERAKYIDVAIQHQHIRLYVFRGVPMDTQFEARTRKEISKIEWWKLSDLPTLKKKKQQQEGRGEDLALNANRFYMVAPFLVPLKKWIAQQKKLGKSNSSGQVQNPIENETEELPTHTDSDNGNGVITASNDVERLLAGLRQPSPASIIDGAPVSNTTNPAEKASQQLKNLLRVPLSDKTGSVPQKPAQTQLASNVEVETSIQENKALTLLALLKGGKSNGGPPEPQTPLEHIKEPSSVPRSPKPQHAVESRLSTLPPPPVFQFDQKHTIQTRLAQLPKPDTASVGALPALDQYASINAWNAFESTSAKQDAERRRMFAEKRAADRAREEQTGIRHEPQLPVMNETWRQVKVHDNATMHQAHERHVVNSLKRPVGGLPQSQHPNGNRPTQQRAASSTAPQPVAAPYQATSSVQIPDSLQYQDIYRPSIPPANKLPMPKLTSHSSTLLDLFKDGQHARVATAPKKAPGPPKAAADSQTPGRAMTNSNTREQLQQASDMAETTGLADSRPNVSSPSLQKLGDSKHPQSAHKANLLDLFRKPSVSAKAPSPPSQVTLDVPANLVELSATPSPGHSRHTSGILPNSKRERPGSPSGKPALMQKPRVGTKHGNPPVSATVSGPLNVPQFEMIARKTEGSGRKPPAPARDIKKSPVTILARPSTVKANQSAGQSEQTILDGQHTQAPAIPPPVGLNPQINQSHESKRFQPQILRRPPPPAEKAEMLQQTSVQPPSQPPVEKRESPSPLSASDCRSSARPEHKATLLSLFTKTSSPVHSPRSSSRPDLSAFVSPVATKPPVTFPLPSKRVNSNPATMPGTGDSVMPSVRQSSEAVEPRVGVWRINSAERKMPTRKMTSEADRSFLLGYLDNVAKKEGK